MKELHKEIVRETKELLSDQTSTMDLAGSETIETPALGRPFNLGMLYDCRADKLVPGLTLWDREELESNMRVTSKPNSEFEIVASESFSAKFSSLGIDSSLKASFLCGLVSVDGSAKYLKDNKTLKNQARVTLQYKTTTQFKELTMNQLGKDKVKHSYVFEQGIATHVVTAILYGAQAFFVFDREVSDTENIQNIQGNVKTVIKKIPILLVGDGALKIEDKDRENVNKFSCKFHGDFRLEQSPTTFEEAVKVYQDLPKLLGPNGEKAVPVKVWLLPLTTLDPTAAKLVREISLRLVLEAESVLELFGDLQMRCNDVLKSTAGHQFPQISKKIKTFMTLCSESNLGLQGKLAKKIPAIRGGGEDEAELTEIMKSRAASPFNRNSLKQWMDCREKEAYTLMSLTNLMTNTKVVPSENHLFKEASSIKKAVCFVFTSLESADPYLSALENYLKGVQSDEPDQRAQDIDKKLWYGSNVCDFAEIKDSWYCLKDVCDAMRRKAKLFRDFAEANKDNSNIGFLAVGFTQPYHKGSTIYIYKNGFNLSDNFEPPSKPDAVTVDNIQLNSVTVKFSPPRFGAEALTSYRVEYCVSGQEEWHQQTETKAGEVTVTGLTANTEYSFRVRAITDVGVGPAAQVNTSIKTLPEPEVPRRLAEDVKKISTRLETQGALQIFTLPLITDELNIQGCKRFIYGQDSEKRNRTIMVIGAKGAGKTTLINAMVNYILGVQWSDSYRFKLIVENEAVSQTQSQTSEVTVYKLNYQDGFQIDYSLTVIDTPGFGDIGGNRRDKAIMEQIRTLFYKESGVNDIHAFCYLAPSALARLNTSQRFVFDSLLSIFGNEVAENIKILVTFADGQLPPVLNAITDAKVSCPKTDEDLPAHFKFNNSALFATNQSSTKDFDEMFWNMGNTSMKSFFGALEQNEPKNFTFTEPTRRRDEIWASLFSPFQRQ